jgi:hypothetical protein
VKEIYTKVKKVKYRDDPEKQVFEEFLEEMETLL